MFRNSNSAHDLHRQRPLRRAGFWMALAVPAIAPILFTVVTVQSVSLSPTDMPSGSLSTGTVTLNTPLHAGTTVALASSTPSLATVPSTVSVRGGTQTGTFRVSTVPGQAGCFTISAAVAGTPAVQSGPFYVQPLNSPGPVTTPTLSTNPILGGLSLTGTVVVTGGTGQVQLTSSNPSVTVPATVTLISTKGLGVGTFNISTKAVALPGTCAIITATFQGSQRRALLKVSPIVQG